MPWAEPRPPDPRGTDTRSPFGFHGFPAQLRGGDWFWTLPAAPGEFQLGSSEGVVQAGPEQRREGGAADSSAACRLQGGEAEGHQNLGRSSTATRCAHRHGRLRQGHRSGAVRQEPGLPGRRHPGFPAGTRRVPSGWPGSDRLGGQHEGGEQARGRGGRGGDVFSRCRQARLLADCRISLYPVHSQQRCLSEAEEQNLILPRWQPRFLMLRGCCIVPFASISPGLEAGSGSSNVAFRVVADMSAITPTTCLCIMEMGARSSFTCLRYPVGSQPACWEKPCRSSSRPR